jgi:peptidoglycan glycosyltransferase
MNQPIARLFSVVLVMFALLVIFTSRWTVFEASALRANPNNKRPGLEQQYVQRGTIVAADQTTVLADSVRENGGIYVRNYRFGPLFAPPLGYYDPNNGRTGLERYRDGALAGSPLQHSSIVAQLEGKRTNGDEVVTTLDVHAQQVAYAGLAGRAGAVVAIVPSTGAIRVFANSPSYDPNKVKTKAGLDAIQAQTKTSPLLDRVTQSQYAPGSTFKVVTAIAAIDSGRYTPNSVLSGRSPIVVSGAPLSNDGGTSYGKVSLSTALTQSINTVWAQVALGVGAPTLQTYMNRLGFYSVPPIDLPSGEVAQSGVRYTNRPGYLPVTAGADVGRVGIGEGGLEVTPLQMAMVASAVANGGRLMVPHLTSEIVNPDGQTVETIAPRLYGTVMKPSTAQEVGQMMENVVNDGTGTQAALTGIGIKVAGKTGTAQDCANLALLACQANQVWFIAYAPVDHPRIAIAVTLEHQLNGFGGSIAAPIAKQVLEALLRGGGA